jgi:hypothetical protein
MRSVRVLAIFWLLAALAANAASAQESSSKLLQDFEKRFPPTKKNSAAEEVERQAIALGIGWASGPEAEHPAREDKEAYDQAGLSDWLIAQLKTSDDFIAPAPPKLQEYLQKHQSPLWRLAGRLEQDVPDWGYDLRDRRPSPNGMLPNPPELPLSLALNRLLVAAALVEERAGHHVEAEQLLEASWSLTRAFTELPDLLSRMYTAALIKAQAGGLRKMSQPSFGWIERMSSGQPWRETIEFYENEPFVALGSGSEPGAYGALFDAELMGFRALADKLRELSPCKASKLSDDEIGQPIEEAARKLTGDGDNDEETTAVLHRDTSSQGLRRAASLAVDRELTAKILELRQEKAADRKGRWPEKLSVVGSRVCPEATYDYQSRGSTMLIRFKGSLVPPGAPDLVLPLSFEARPPAPTKTPTRAALPTPTPKPAANP